MGWFMNLAWERFGGLGIFTIASIYALGFILAGRHFWFREDFKTVGGLLFTMAVAMTPLIVYGLERGTGFWPAADPGVYRGFHQWIRGGWVLMELGTVLTGLIALAFVRFPFLTAPVAFALWYMSMDLTPLIVGNPMFTWKARLWVSLCFGLVILLASFLVDRRTKQDFAFWGYLFGMLSFWGGLSLMESGSQFAKFGYCLINVGLMLVSILLQRRVFMVFGALGVFGYLGYLAYDVFKDSMSFPFVLSGLGLLVIFCGVMYQRNSRRVEDRIRAAIPGGLQQLLPPKRAVV